MAVRKGVWGLKSKFLLWIAILCLSPLYGSSDSQNRFSSTSVNYKLALREWTKFTGTHPGQTDDGAETFFTPEINEVVSFLAFKIMGR